MTADPFLFSSIQLTHLAQHYSHCCTLHRYQHALSTFPAPGRMGRAVCRRAAAGPGSTPALTGNGQDPGARRWVARPLCCVQCAQQLHDTMSWAGAWAARPHVTPIPPTHGTPLARCSNPLSGMPFRDCDCQRIVKALEFWADRSHLCQKLLRTEPHQVMNPEA